MNILDGRFVGNGEKNLYIKELGTGNPIIVIEPDWGGFSFEWQYIQEELSKYTKVITYDRAGYGESPISKNQRTSMQIAKELYITLQNSGNKGPYLFIAHGAGGLYVQHLLKMFASYVEGIIFVDSLTIYEKDFEDLDLENYNKIASLKVRLQNFKKYSELTQSELENNIVPLISKLYSNYPDSIRNAYLTYLTDVNYYKTVYNEMDNLYESINLFKELSLFTNIPISILVRDYNVMLENAQKIGIPIEEQKIIEEKWLNNSKDLENLSTDSKLSIVKGSSHNIHFDNPNVIIEETLNILNKSD